MGNVKLRTPRLRVVMADDTIHEIQALNVDLLNWDRTRVKHAWPTQDQAPGPWATFIAWSVLTRTGAIDGMTFREFESAALEVSVTEVAGIDISDRVADALAAHDAGRAVAPVPDDDDVVSPTRPGPAPG